MAVSVKHSVNVLPINHLVGRTAGEIYDAVKEAMNIPEGSEVRINGSAANMDTIVTDGSTVEFVKKAGEKGNA